MHPLINLVSTRCIEGQHALLQRWYADHVQLLLTSPQLLGAQLHRCVDVLHGQPPDYACAYDFSNWASFELFETSAEKAQATELTNTAAGRSAVEIVQRVQYACLLHCHFGDAPAISPQSLLIQLNLHDALPLPTTRWLADMLQEARAALPLHSAQVLAGAQEKNLWQLHLSLGACHSSLAWELIETLLQQTPLYGQAPERWHAQWVAGTAPVMQWLR